MSDIALTVSLLALVAVLGLWIGNWRIYGVGLGIGGVLFGGIIVGHFAQTYALDLNGDMLHFIQEFGLILFVYTIGIQVGPGFFSSLRVSGLRLNGFAVLMVVLSGVVTALIHKLFGVPLPVILGVFSGAVTNTPALGAGQQILTDLGSDPALVDKMGMGYAMAYPFGICGILLVMWLLRLIFRISVDAEARDFDAKNGLKHELLQTMNISVRNPNLAGMPIHSIPIINSDEIVCSRLKRGEHLMVPLPDTVLELGDLIHLVGQKQDLENARLVIGDQVDTSLSTRGTALQVSRVVVTNEKVLGKKIRDLNLKQKYDVVISRLN
ncbi:MAG: putative transporter, partial [Enterobacterales bacterium]|nr:putative transporter [Enterobacterales bacterium]